VVTSHGVILLASGDIEGHTSVRLFPLNIIFGYPATRQTTRSGTRVTNYPDMAALTSRYVSLVFPILFCNWFSQLHFRFSH